MWTLWMSIGCPGPETPSETTDASGLDLTCVLSATNALRATCTVRTDPPAAVTLAWGPPDAPGRDTKALPAALETSTTLLWLEPRTVHTITATLPDGTTQSATVEGGSLSESIASTFEVEGTSSVSRVLHESACEDSGYVMISTTRGQPVWYERLGPDTEPISFVSATMTEDGTVIALGEGETYHGVREVDLEGNILFEIEQFVDFDIGIHHDVVKKNGFYYVLFHETITHDGKPYLVDGFYVFDPSAAILAEWRLLDQITLPPDEDKDDDKLRDFSHANSLFVDGDGNVLVSIRNMSAVALVRGDWTAPDFGTFVWWLGGDPGQPDSTTEFEYVSSAGTTNGFFQQHHASLFEPGRLTLFDNQRENANSRLLSIALDPVAPLADIDEIYSLDRHCEIQGAFYRGPGGSAIGTCPITRTMYEYPSFSPKPSFTMSSECVFRQSDGVYRYVPVDDLLP